MCHTMLTGAPRKRGVAQEDEGLLSEQMERSTVGAAHEALRAEHEALQGEASDHGQAREEPWR